MRERDKRGGVGGKERIGNGQWRVDEQGERKREKESAGQRVRGGRERQSEMVRFKSPQMNIYIFH